MGGRHADRLWIFGGVVVMVLVVLGSYFLAIKPEYDDAATITDQRKNSELQLITLRKRLSELKVQKAQKGKYVAQRDTKLAALPATAQAVPDFLRQLQTTSEQVQVDVTGFSVSAPKVVADAGSPSVYAVPITVGVTGTAAGLGDFLTRLQNVQPQAVVINNASLTPKSGDAGTGTETTDTETGAGAGTPTDAEMSLNLSLDAFVAPPAGSGAPTITTTN